MNRNLRRILATGVSLGALNAIPALAATTTAPGISDHVTSGVPIDDTITISNIGVTNVTGVSATGGVSETASVTSVPTGKVEQTVTGTGASKHQLTP